MLDVITAGGWVMLPMLLCSVVAVAITAEKYWSLQRKYVIPNGLLARTWSAIKQQQLSATTLKELQVSSPLGKLLAKVINSQCLDRQTQLAMIEEAGRHVVHDLQRYLETLGTIAAITPLLGLLGTVIGMIDVFSMITSQGVANNGSALAGGIATALITTAAGLLIAIPSFVVHRHLNTRIEALAIELEQSVAAFHRSLCALADDNGVAMTEQAVAMEAL